MKQKTANMEKSDMELREYVSQVKLAKKEEQQRQWSAQGLSEFNELIRKSDDLKQLCRSLISKLVNYLEANQGGLFLVETDSHNNSYLQLMSSYAYERQKFLEKRVEIGQGLTGQVVLEKKTLHLEDIPKGYTHITSGLGLATPKHLAIVPLMVNNEVYGVLEIASFSEILPHQIAFLEKLGENIASALSSLKTSEQTKKLLDELQKLNQEQLSQEEEMRQNFEELQATQEELNRQKDKTDQFMDSLDKGTIMLDFSPEGTILHVSHAFCERYGYTYEEVVGKDRSFYMPESEQRTDDFEEVVQGALNEDYYFRDLKRKTKNGDTIHLRAYYLPIYNAKGELEKSSCICAEITDLMLETANS
jgi:PAS domain S-box-containing protein